MVDEVLASLFYRLRVGFLSVKRLFSVRLEVFLMARVYVKTMAKRGPLCLVDELICSTTAFFLVGYDPIVDIKVIEPQRALLGDLLRPQVILLNITVGFKSLRASVWGCEVIFTLKTLVTFNCIFELELDLGVIRGKLQAHFID